MHRIDLIQTSKPKSDIQAWFDWHQGIPLNTGLQSHEISQVYRRLHRDGYDLVSITEWQSIGHLRASDHYRQPNPVNPLSGPEANLYEVINLADRDDVSPEAGDLIVTNPYRIPKEEAQENARMWDESKNHMCNQPGFVNARLYRQWSDQCDYYYVSQARWRSETDFMKQFEGKDFQKIIAAFEGKFSICFSSRVQIHSATTKEAFV